MGFLQKLFGKKPSDVASDSVGEDFGFKVGDRVRYNDGFGAAKPADTGFKDKVLQRNKMGTVSRLGSEGLVTVKWDAGEYEIYDDIVSGPAGLSVTTKGSVRLEAFETEVHVSNMEKANGVAKSPPTESDVDQTRCAACRKEFSWDTAFHQRHTPGAPSPTSDFWPRAFCPHCGSLVAEWSGHSDEWSWYGENAALNSGKRLPPSSLVPWGHPIARGSEPSFHVRQVDTKKLKTVF